MTIVSSNTTVRLHYDLADLRALRDNRWKAVDWWLTISATDDAGNRISITTTGEGEGEFAENYMRQYVGTCDFSVRGWSDNRARRELRRRYDEMMERKRHEEEMYGASD